MLHDMDAFAGQRGVVEGGQVPYTESAYRQRPGEGGLSEYALDYASMQGCARATGRMRQACPRKQRWHYKHQQQMLKHVRAEKVIVAQRVDGRHKCKQQHEHSGEEG